MPGHPNKLPLSLEMGSGSRGEDRPSTRLTRDWVELAGGRRQVVYRGGGGPPLVWLHGLNGPEADAALIAPLTRDFTIYAPLAPGFADLDELHDLRDIHDLALRYDDILDALGIDQTVLIGNSFGAMIAAELAAHYPGRVSRLVLISSLGLWNDAYPVADLFAVPPPELPGLLYAHPETAPRIDGGSSAADVEAIVQLVSGMTSVARFLWPIPDRGLARRLYRIRTPTLVIHGERDAFVAARYADDFVAALTDARKYVVPDAGHMLAVEGADEVLAEVQRFVSHKEAHT